MRDSIRNDKTAKAATVQILDSLAGKNAVDDNGIDFLGTVLHDCVSGFGESAASISHIIDDDGDFALDVPDENHAGDFVGSGAFLVDQGELEVEAVGNGSGPNYKFINTPTARKVKAQLTV